MIQTAKVYYKFKNLPKVYRQKAKRINFQRSNSPKSKTSIKQEDSSVLSINRIDRRLGKSYPTNVSEKIHHKKINLGKVV